MRTIIKNGIEMVELNTEEHAFLDARIASLKSGKSPLYAEEEIDEIFRQQDLDEERNIRRHRSPCLSSHFHG
jgi:hypothetical protein